MAERWERRLGGLLEGEGGGKQGWLQSQNRAAGCGGHDDAPGGRLRAPCGRPAALQPLSLTLQSKVESEQKKARLSNECLPKSIKFETVGDSPGGWWQELWNKS